MKIKSSEIVTYLHIETDEIQWQKKRRKLIEGSDWQILYDDTWTTIGYKDSELEEFFQAELKKFNKK